MTWLHSYVSVSEPSLVKVRDLLVQRWADVTAITGNHRTQAINSQMKERFSCTPHSPLPGSLQLHSPLERNLRTICKVSCLFHYAATCYYKHTYSLCFSTQMQPCRDGSWTEPTSRGRMSNSCGKKLFLLRPTKLFIHEECLSSGLLILEGLSERDSEKFKSNFVI